MKIATFDGPPVDIANGALGDLRARLRGRLLIEGDPAYDRARVVFNGLFDRRPALIAQCADPADVAEAVQFATGRRLRTAIRGGGHSIAGKAVTPYLLAHFHERTAGASLTVNVKIILRNAALAAQIATAYHTTAAPTPA